MLPNPIHALLISLLAYLGVARADNNPLRFSRLSCTADGAFATRRLARLTVGGGCGANIVVDIPIRA
eukprot:scaffold298657_cov14-Prasinocladus_malaysianus.AAC.1